MTWGCVAVTVANLKAQQAKQQALDEEAKIKDLRITNPAVKDAWEQYLITERLAKE